MLNTCCMPFVVPSGTGVSKTMAEANELMLDESSSQCPRKGNPRLQSAEKDPIDHHGDSLHRLLQKAALQSQQNLNWSHSMASRTPQNLFIEGFRDCASEVIRFLTQEENVDDNSPLLVGLQSHLTNVSKTFCNESVADLDKQDGAAMEQLNYDGLTTATTDNHNSVCQCYSNNSPFSLCMISPIAARSVNSSLSESSVVESDLSMSVSSGKGHLSSSSEANSSLCSTSAEIHDESFIDSSKIDDVFHSPDTHSQELTSCCVLPLQVLSVKAIQNKNHPGHEKHQETSNIKHHFGHKVIPELSTKTSHPEYIAAEESSFKNQHQCEVTKDSSNLNVSSLSRTEAYTHDSWNPVNSVPYHSSLNHSSPLPNSSIQSAAFSAHPCRLSQCLCTVSRLEDPDTIKTNNIPQLSTFSAMHESGDLNSNHSVPGLLLPQQLQNLLQEKEQMSSQSLFQHFPPATSCSSGESHRHSESSHPMNSLLELKANLFPQIETSSQSSSSFADVLLAVESCRFHEDPRVRSIAEELVHLIHNDESLDEDDFDYDPADDDEEYLYNIDEANDVESAIEMLDESSDWSSAVDMIEQ